MEPMAMIINILITIVANTIQTVNSPIMNMSDPGNAGI